MKIVAYIFRVSIKKSNHFKLKVEEEEEKNHNQI